MYTRHTIIDTVELGQLTLVATDGDLTGIYYPHHWTRPDRSLFGDAVEAGADSLLSEAASQVRGYLAGDRADFDLPIATHGDVFQEQVWGLLLDLAYGQTTTYGELAEKLGDRNLARMVGRAVGANPLSIIIGCHRVLGKDGKLTGYAGGLERKEFLLRLEGAPIGSAATLF